MAASGLWGIHEWLPVW